MLLFIFEQMARLQMTKYRWPCCQCLGINIKCWEVYSCLGGWVHWHILCFFGCLFVWWLIFLFAGKPYIEIIKIKKFLLYIYVSAILLQLQNSNKTYTGFSYCQTIIRAHEFSKERCRRIQFILWRAKLAAWWHGVESVGQPSCLHWFSELLLCNIPNTEQKVNQIIWLPMIKFK